MYYIVTLQSPRHKQMSLEDLLFSPEDSVFQTVYYNTTANTRVFEVESISSELRNKTPISYLKSKLRDFNEKTAELRTVPREQLYYSFKIPKRTGGLRQIDAPIDSLKEALNELSRFAAQYSEVNCTPDDIRLYLDRIARGMPVAGKAAHMSNEELSDYLQSMREKKQGSVPVEE